MGQPQHASERREGHGVCSRDVSTVSFLRAARRASSARDENPCRRWLYVRDSRRVAGRGLQNPRVRHRSQLARSLITNTQSPHGSRPHGNVGGKGVQHEEMETRSRVGAGDPGAGLWPGRRNHQARPEFTERRRGGRCWGDGPYGRLPGRSAARRTLAVVRCGARFICRSPPDVSPRDGKGRLLQALPGRLPLQVGPKDWHLRLLRQAVKPSS